MSSVQTYAFWNHNEPRKDQFDFTGDGDISQFPSTAQKLGLYATLRPGPCVEA
jgi:beta-galactosidase